MNRKLRIWKEEDAAYLKLSLNCLGDTKETHEKHQPGLPGSRDSNWVPPEYTFFLVARYLRASFTVTEIHDGDQPAEVWGDRRSDSS
jgi:hypothetical protein